MSINSNIRSAYRAGRAAKLNEEARIKQRLEYLRGELRGERIGTGELLELQSLASHIEPGDVELLEAAGVPEHSPTLEQRIREAQGEPQGEAWDFDVPRLQAGIESGSIWGMEGSVGRAANDALVSGACFLPSAWKDGADRPFNDETIVANMAVLKAPMRDYWGNLIPYREMLKPGSKGTLENSARFYEIEI